MRASLSPPIAVASRCRRRAGSAGMIAFGAGEGIVLRPRGARPGLAAVRDLLAAGVAPDGGRDAESLASSLRARSLEVAVDRAGGEARLQLRSPGLPRGGKS